MREMTGERLDLAAALRSVIAERDALIMERQQAHWAPADATLRATLAEATAERDALRYEVQELARRLDDAIGRDWRESVYGEDDSE
jgi:hypothetical protein